MIFPAFKSRKYLLLKTTILPEKNKMTSRTYKMLLDKFILELICNFLSNEENNYYEQYNCT